MKFWADILKIGVMAAGLAAILLSLDLSACRTGVALAEGPDDWEDYWNTKQPPEKVMDALGVAPGMVVGEVGAGRGRYVVKMARRVGPAGKVYANDIKFEALVYLASRCERDSIPNVETILGSVTDPRLPAGELDLVYVINSYHHFDQPVALLRNMAPALKRDGRLVIIEHDPVKTNSSGHSTAQDTVRSHATAAGYELIAIKTFLELDTIYIFKIAE
jgi:ubiquinone/menaquinone biosynthesis C-methylase UbiE